MRSSRPRRSPLQTFALRQMAKGPLLPEDPALLVACNNLLAEGLCERRPDGSYAVTPAGEPLTVSPKKGRPSGLVGAWGALADAYGGPTKLAEALGVKYGTVHRWATGRNNPNAPARKLIALVAAAVQMPSPVSAFLFACCLAWLVVGCGHSLNTHPNVFVDRDFGADTSEVIEGVHAWDGAGIRPEVTLMDHKDIMAAVRAPGPDDEYMIAYVDPFTRGIAPGVTMLDHDNGSAISQLDVVYIRANPVTPAGNFRRAAGHEMGHALGLAHDLGEASLMLNRYNGSAVPSCVDYAQLASDMGTSVPGDCKD